MNPFRLAPLALAVLPVTLHAQASAREPLPSSSAVYAGIAITHYGLDYDSNFIYYKSGDPGFVAGGYYNFPIASRVTVGLDLRGTGSFGAKGGGAGALGLRVGFVPHHVRLSPWFVIGGGAVSTTTNTELVTDGFAPKTYTSGGAELAFGLDIRLTPRIDYRVLEIGAIAGSSVVSYADTGLVYHFGLR